MVCATPLHFARLHAETVRGLLPKVYDGDVEAVHDARIATRRLRELVPLALDGRARDTLGHLTIQVALIGRALGRVRDADVHIDLIRYLQTRVSVAAPSLAWMQQAYERERGRSVRKLIKRFERLEVPHVIDELIAELSPRRFALDIRRGWRQELRHAIHARAREAAAALEHGTGVYFPNRLHGARVALKKFRYAAEIDAMTGNDRITRALKALRKTQDVLGQLHDRQVVLDELPRRMTRDGHELPDLALVTQVVDAECRDLHARYLERRPGVLEICRDAQRVTHEWRPLVTPALAAGALAVLAALSTRPAIAAHAAATAQPRS